MKLITIKIVHLHESCKGDINRFAGESNRLEVVSPGDSLCAVANALKDIELINGRRCSDIYTARVLTTWREICDAEAYELFTGRIQVYAPFQAVAEILCQISRKIHPSTDTARAGFDSPAAFLHELKQDIMNIRNCSFTTLGKILIEFAPTCSYQELSMANGWTDEYLKLAEEFDSLYCRLVGPKECAEKFAKAKRWWKFW